MWIPFKSSSWRRKESNVTPQVERSTKEQVKDSQGGWNGVGSGEAVEGQGTRGPGDRGAHTRKGILRSSWEEAACCLITGSVRQENAHHTGDIALNGPHSREGPGPGEPQSKAKKGKNVSLACQGLPGLHALCTQLRKPVVSLCFQNSPPDPAIMGTCERERC